MAKLLIIDDEPTILESIEMFMSEKGYEVLTAGSYRESLSIFEREVPEVVVLDIRLPDGCGLEALSRMHALNPLAKIIMITAFQDMETTIEAMKRGAYDYLHKPLDAVELEKTVADAVKSYCEDCKIAKTEDCRSIFNDQIIIGKSRAMKDVFKMIGILCQSRATVLITGETGTGKELVARRIHLSSPDSHKPFVIFDCSSVVDTLLESELFGHEKGAFTGAIDSRPGKIELAGDGTLFLDEIGELPMNLQSKLLGFLERREFSRVGGKKILQSRCRIIAATNRDLGRMVAEKRFRSDLYFRLKVVILPLPPLRDRRSDIPDLAEYFLKKCRMKLGIRKMFFQDGCMERLQSHSWSGNVRELENVVVSSAIQSRGNVILLETIDALVNKTTSDQGSTDGLVSLAQMEKVHIQKVLDSVQWNKTRASRILEISLPTLRSKIKKYNLNPVDDRKDCF